MTGLWVACIVLSVLPLILLPVLWRRARRWQGNRWVFRALFALQLALLSPTLLMAQHVALPVPSIAALTVVLVNLPGQERVFIDVWAFGSDYAALLTTPFLLVLAIALFLPWPRLPQRRGA